MVPHLKTPIHNAFYHLLWFYKLTASEFGCFVQSYSVSGLPPLPHIPNQRHFIQTIALQVPGANMEARVMPGFS